MDYNAIDKWREKAKVKELDNIERFKSSTVFFKFLWVFKVFKGDYNKINHPSEVTKSATSFLRFYFLALIPKWEV